MVSSDKVGIAQQINENAAQSPARHSVWQAAWRVFRQEACRHRAVRYAVLARNASCALARPA
ncbi:hypothetical protein GCM10007907_41480 [Chitinimonas prasina]|uniref:Uncharacterized protein n=1 Tax=Chitinimonas prasina TaxID=1434937 RepID=A0ABQ5YLR0_9NEIS|nr:hypothetical protein GCM10007907_41480 [Chitinimonas prasina]